MCVVAVCYSSVLQQLVAGAVQQVEFIKLVISHDASSVLQQCVVSTCYRNHPPKKPIGGGVSTPYTTFCLICTITSEITYFLICTTNERAGVDICWFPVDGFETRLIPRSFSCGW